MCHWRGRALSGAAEKFAGRTRLQRAGRRGTIPFATKSATGFATKSTHTDATKRFFRRSRPRSVTRKTSFRSRFSHNVCRYGCCAKMLRIARRCSSAQRVSWRRPISTSTKNRRANTCGNCGTVGGRIATSLQRLILPAKTWRISGTRPLNHPQRRLAALAVLAREWPRLQRASGKSSVAAANDFFQTLEHPFWNFHYTLTSEASPKEMALIGESRVADILANVLFPFWVAHDIEASTSPNTRLWTEYAKLPAQLSNRRLETAATRLFGNDPRRKQFLRTVAHQQGLLQIYEDFCMQDNSDCAQCPFPEQMAKWK